MKYIGIDVGGTAIKAGAVDSRGNVIVKESMRTKAQEAYDVLARDIAEIAGRVASRCHAELKDFQSIGIGFPGSVDSEKGAVIYANNLSVSEAPLCKAVSDLTGLPAYIGNDANCAALGEFFALEDESIRDLIAVTLGTGVGGGIIINKRIYTGFNGTAGEIGHIMIKSGGEHCTCGRDGCWEAYASVTALVRDTLRAAAENPCSYLAKLVRENNGKASGKTAFLAAERGDETGKTVVANYVKYVAEGIVDIINIFQPQIVVVGGGISREGDPLIKPVREHVYKYIYGADTSIRKPEIRLAKLGNDAGIVGAALLGIK